MTMDRTLPVVIYGHSPVPDWHWHKAKKVSTNVEYAGDLCRADRKAELRKRWLSLEPNFPKDAELLAGHDRPAVEPRHVSDRPLNVPARMSVIYCVKTGQPVGSMEYEGQYFPNAVARAWLQTDGDSLDTMQSRDPRGYVAFCLGLIDQFWRSTAHKSRVRIEATEHHWSLVRTYELLGSLPEHHLSELGNALCRFITYAPLSYRVLDQKLLPARRSADLLAETAQAGALLAILEKATIRTLVHAENYSKAGASIKTPKFEIIPESIKDAAKGPSNIRSQSTSRNYQANAKQNKLMADIMRLAGFAEMFGRSNVAKQSSDASGLMARLAKNTDKLDTNIVRGVSLDDSQKDMLAELETLMGQMPVETWDNGDDMDDDDNEVIVRRIPRQLVESLSEPREVPIVPKTPISAPMPSVRLSLAERARRNSQQ